MDSITQAETPYLNGTSPAIEVVGKRAKYPAHWGFVESHNHRFTEDELRETRERQSAGEDIVAAQVRHEREEKAKESVLSHFGREPSELALEFMRLEMSGWSQVDLLNWAQNRLSNVLQQSDPSEYVPQSELETLWTIFDASDALEPPAPTQWLVQDFLEMGSLGIWYSAPKTLKTMLLQDLAVCVAAGVPWLPPAPGTNGVWQPLQTGSPIPVLWLDKDNGIRRTRIRIGAILRGRNLPSSTPIQFVSMSDPTINFADGTWVAQLCELVKKRGHGLVCIDNLVQVANGADENDNAKMNLVTHNMRRLVDATGAAVQVIHHAKKGNSGGAASADLMRGASSILGAIDQAYYVDRKGGTDSISILMTAQRDYSPHGMLAADFAFEHYADSSNLRTAIFHGKQPQPADARNDAYLDNVILGEASKLPGQSMTALKTSILSAIAVDEGKPQGFKTPGQHNVYGRIRKLAEKQMLTLVKGKQNSEHVYPFGSVTEAP